MREEETQENQCASNEIRRKCNVFKNTGINFIMKLPVGPYVVENCAI